MIQDKGMVVLIATVAFVLCVSSATTSCPKGQFYNRKTAKCSFCSGCPPNEIIRRTCSRNKDTVCGPFHEWRDSSSNVPEEDHDRHETLVGVNSVERDVTSKEGPNKKTGDPVTHQDDTTYHMVSVTSENHWKVVSFCLMAVVALLLLGMVTFCVLRLTRKRKKPDDLVYLRTRVFSRDRLSTSDYVRYLSDIDIELGPYHNLRKKRLQRLFKPGKGAEFRDEVFDVSDESIYKSVNNGKFRLPAIPEELLECKLTKTAQTECGCAPPNTCSHESSSSCKEECV